MKNPDPDSLTYIGRVKGGVVVFDGPFSLEEGQAVRIEPLNPNTGTPDDVEREDRVRQLRELFAEWNEEDAKLSDEEADCLRIALEQNRGLHFRQQNLD